MVDHVAAAMATERIVLLGFSQGACLALEYAARHAQRYGGVVGLSGGLIGADATPRDYGGSLDGTPVLLGCDDDDFHIPAARVDETAIVLERLGAMVDKRLYHGHGTHCQPRRDHRRDRAAQGTWRRVRKRPAPRLYL